MASDGDRKDRDKAHIDPFIFGDDDGWSSAIDEWDKSLDLPADLARTGAIEEPTPVPGIDLRESLCDQTTPAPLIEGEIELEESAGQALGALLGSSTPSQQRTPMLAETLPGLPVEDAGGAGAGTAAGDLGPLPDEVSAVESEVEIAPHGLEETKTPPLGLLQPSLEDQAPRAEVAAIDLESLLGRLATGETPAHRPDPAAGPVPRSADAGALAPPGTPDGGDLPGERPLARRRLPPEEALKKTGPGAGPSISAESLLDDVGGSVSDIFDQIAPPPLDIDATDEVEAGDVLPRPQPKPAATKTHLIPVDVEEELEEPALQPPPLPEDLARIDLEQLVWPDEAHPLTLDRTYWERLAERLRLEADLCDSSRRAAELELMVAAAHEELGEVDEAINHYREVLNHQSGHLPAGRSLRRLNTSRREHGEVAELLGAMADQVGPLERRALLLSRAELLWSLGGDDEGARRILEDLSGRSEDRRDEVRLLLLQADLAAASGDEEGLRAAVSRLAERISADSPQRAALQLEQGRLLEIAGRAFEARGAYGAAMAADRGQRMGGAAEGLIRTTALLEDWPGFAAALASSAVLAKGDWAARRLRRSATFARQRGLPPPGETLAALRQAAAGAQGVSPFIADELARLLVAADEVPAAVEELRQLARALDEDDDEGAQALLAAAQLAEDRLADSGLACDLLEAAASRPGGEGARARLARLLLRDPDPRRRVAALQSEAERQPAAAAIHRLVAAGLLAAELQEPQAAIAELESCFAEGCPPEPVLSRLEELLRQGGDLTRLAETLDALAGRVPGPEESAGLRQRAAAVLETGLGRPEEALARYRQVLEAFPECGIARRGLHRCLTKLGHSVELVEELAGQAGVMDDAAEAARLWAARGQLLQSLGREHDAESSYRLALGRVPEHPAALWSLANLLIRRGRLADAVLLWESAAAGLPDGHPELAAVRIRVASAQENCLSGLEEAAAQYVLAAEGSCGAPGALEGLLRVLRRAGNETRLAVELERELAQASDPAARFAILVAGAELARRAEGDWEQARDRYLKALEVQPEHPVARQALEELFSAERAWAPLVELLEHDLRSSVVPEDRLALLERTAQIQLDQDRNEQARSSLESIIAIVPGHIVALRALARLHLAAGRSDELEAVLRQEAELAREPADAAALWLDIARRLAQRVVGGESGVGGSEENPDVASKAAQEAYLRALEHEPTARLPLCALLELAVQRRGESAEVAAAYVRLARAGSGGREAAVYLTRAAGLQREESVALCREALSLASDSLAVIYRLRDAALRQGDWLAAFEAAEAEGRASSVREQAEAAFLLAGEIAQRELSDSTRAVAAYRAALEVAPESRRAFELLRRILEEDGLWPELADLIEQRTAVERSRARRLELYRELAEIARSRLGDNERARKQLRLLLKQKPADLVALGALADLELADEQWTEAAQSLIKMARLERDAAGLRRLFLRLGHIYKEKTPDSRRAIASYGRVIALDPGNLEALAQLSELYLAERDFKRALKVTSQLFDRHPETAARVSFMLRMAKIHEDGFQDVHQASICYRQAQELDPLNLQVMEELTGFFARQRDQRSLLVHLDRSVAAMRGRLEADAFDSFAYGALFRIFGWRNSPDACLCAAQALEAFAACGPEERAFIEARAREVASPGSALGAPEHDELIFKRTIPGGFRQVFRLLAEPLSRIYRGDLRHYETSRTERVSSSDHALRRIGDELARDLFGRPYEIYLVQARPTLLVVENTDPPAVLIGSSLLDGASEAEARFALARCLWIISKSMILPTRLLPEELEVLVAGIVRQYSPDFEPVGADPRALAEATRQVARAMPRKLRQELMPFALECSGPTVDLRGLRVAALHSANRAGLLACRSISAATKVLCRVAAKKQGAAPQEGADLVAELRSNLEVQELLRFAVSDEHFELRRGMTMAVRL